MTDPSPTSTAGRNGVLLGIGAYLSWGLLPLYLKLLGQVPALQIVAHRILWAVLLLAAIALATRRLRSILAAARRPMLLGLLALTATLIAVNWLVYSWAVINGHVLEASLGYFINPLVNVALGMIVLKERLRRWQAIAVALAMLGVALLALRAGGGLWISLTLALSFGSYGLLRKVAPIDALGGLAIETGLLAPVALAYLWWAGMAGEGAFGRTLDISLLLVGAGVATTLPLLMFAGAARRVRLATLGLLQYLSPTLQFLQAVLLFGEPLTHAQLWSFALIWAGLALYAVDGLRAARAPIVPPPE